MDMEKEKLPHKKRKKEEAHLNEINIIKPTDEQLLESVNPENIKCIETIRQKKKKMHHKITKEKKTKSNKKEISKNIEYLLKWKNSKNEWKFEKLRQISIQNSLFDAEKLNDDVWHLALEYICGTKGDSKMKIISAAEKEIEKFDSEVIELENNSITSSSRYLRARQILQNFD